MVHWQENSIFMVYNRNSILFQSDISELSDLNVDINANINRITVTLIKHEHRINNGPFSLNLLVPYFSLAYTVASQQECARLEPQLELTSLNEPLVWKWEWMVVRLCWWPCSTLVSCPGEGCILKSSANHTQVLSRLLPTHSLHGSCRMER